MALAFCNVHPPLSPQPTTVPSPRENAGSLGFSYVPDKKINWYNYFWKTVFGTDQRQKDEYLTAQRFYSAFLLATVQYLNLQKNICSQRHYSKQAKLETFQMFTSIQKINYTVITCSGALPGKREKDLLHVIAQKSIYMKV